MNQLITRGVIINTYFFLFLHALLYAHLGGTLRIQDRIFVPHYFEQGKILKPFEEYIPL